MDDSPRGALVPRRSEQPAARGNLIPRRPGSVMRRPFAMQAAMYLPAALTTVALVARSVMNARSRRSDADGRIRITSVHIEIFRGDGL